MEFPKPIMGISDLRGMGFSQYSLRELAKLGHPICFRLGGKTSPILFDTAELKKYIERQSKLAEKR